MEMSEIDKGKLQKITDALRFLRSGVECDNVLALGLVRPYERRFLANDLWHKFKDVGCEIAGRYQR